MRLTVPARIVVVALLALTPPAIAAIPSSEHDALVAFYNATGGANWTNKTGWLGAAGTECDWFGVDCDNPVTTVTSIYLERNNLSGTLPGSTLAALPNLGTLGLSRNQLTGSIPPQIGSLSKLTSLWLYDNRLTGSIPSQMGSLSALRELELSANQLTGTIPSELENLSKLQYLSLGNNQLTGGIPESITRLPLLELLDLDNNSLSGSLPASIGQMAALRELQLSANKLTGTIPAELGNLKSIQSLNLCGNQLTGAIPQQLGNLSTALQLILCENQLTGSIPSALGSLTNLQVLNLNGNQLTGSIPTELTQLTNLTSLDLGSNSITGSIPAQISKLTKLDYLGIANAQLSGTIPAEIGQLAALHTLDIYANKLTGTIPSQLGQLHALDTLSLGQNQLTGAVPQEIGNLAALRYLDLSSNKLTGPIPPAIANLKELNYLSLYDNQFTGTIPSFLGSLSKLEDLNFGYNQLSGSIPVELMQLTNLTSLDFGNNNITGSIPPQIGNLTKLGYLGFGDDDLEGAIPSEIGQLTSLQWLYLYSNRLSGSIPSSIGQLAILEVLSLSDNDLTGSIPSEIGNLSKLKVLDLAYNDLSGSIPPEIGKLADLENLTFEYNRIEGSIPREIGQLSKLGFLSLTSNRLSGSLPTELLNLPKLDMLLLGYNSLSGSIPTEVGTLSNLQILTLDRNLFSGAIPSSLGNLRNLRTLALAVNSLQGEIPSQLANLTSLGSGDLDLNYNGLYTSSSSLRTFLNSKQYGGDWEQTQTTTPTNVAVGGTTGNSVVLTWNRIRYYWDDGGYEIFISTSPDLSSPERIVTTACKEQTSEIITGLAPVTTYYFKMRAVTYAHDDQQGTIKSDFSPVVSGKTVTATIQPPNIVITTLPYGMVQDAGAGGGYDYFVLTNIGDMETTVTLTPQGSFFTIDTPSSTIGAGESAYVNVTGLAQPAGAYEGSVALSGTGVKSGLSIAIYLLSVVPPTGSVIAEAAVTRVDLIAPESENPRGTVDFTNTGNATLNGIVVADVPWIVPPDGLVTIAPGGTTTVAFSIDRTKRPDAGELSGAVSGNLSLLYADGRTSLKATGILGDTPPGTSVSTVTVVDTVQRGATSATIPPLATDEIALLVPGVAQFSQTSGTFLSDISIANTLGATAMSDLKIYYGQAGTSGATTVSAVPAVSVNQGLKLANVLQSLFGKQSQFGTLQLRTQNSTGINVFAKMINATSKSGTFGTAIPVFRTDRAARASQKILLPGLRGDSGFRTDIFLQETSGTASSAQIDFVDASGNSVGSARPADAVGAFSLVQLQNVVPANAVTAVVSTGTTGRLVAYAMITDSATGDTWTVLDWARYYDFIPTESQIVPAAGASGSATTGRRRAIRRGSGASLVAEAAAPVRKSDVSIFNGGTTSATATLRYYEGGAATSKTITLPARATKVITDVASFFGRGASSSGYLVLEPQSGSFAMSSRLYQSSGSGAYSAAVPVLSARSGVRFGQTKAMAGLDDSRLLSTQQQIAGTFNTSLVLLETSGKPVKIRATLSYADGRSVVAAIGQGSRDISLAARQYLFLKNLGSAILGSSRETSLGDLDNVKVSFQVIEGDGAVAVLIISSDNASGDPMIRFE